MNEKINYKLLFDKIIDEVKLMPRKPKLLLHACCGPCSSYVLELLTKYFDITILYYNPNIYPKEEYDRRYNELLKFNIDAGYNLKVIEKKYNDAEYYDAIKGKEELGEKSQRCYECYKLRLESTAQIAKTENFDYFTTTLSISPYKVSSFINEIGENLEKKYGVKYLYADFKKDNGYKRSLELSKQYNLYRQEYCGCKFSKKDAERIRIKTLVVGKLEANCYILERSGNVLIIDPGSDTEEILKHLQNKKVLKILITHKHFDHIGSLYDIMDACRVDYLAYDTLEEKAYNIGPFTFEVIETPGHSADSLTYYFKSDNIMFTGDFLFKDSIGRCDLPTGDHNAMLSSLDKIKKYDDNITIYPGHGDKTTLKREKDNNIYLS